MAGTLFVVATPIGNLEDLSFRALRTLREVDIIAAEDTRRTAKLLARYEVRKPLLSLREHNEARETPRLLSRLSEGTSIALVSDAGTPGISDPGARLVRAAREAGVPVVPIPGPSAITTALSVSGVSADAFVFLGFPPSSGPPRVEWLARLATEDRTVVFFESPHRIARTVRDVLEVKQPIIIHRELTKIHEDFVVCTNHATCQLPSGKGEFTVVAPYLGVQKESVDFEAIYRLFSKLVDGQAFSEGEAADLVSKAHGVTVSEVLKFIKKTKISIKRPSP